MTIAVRNIGSGSSQQSPGALVPPLTELWAAWGVHGWLTRAQCTCSNKHKHTATRCALANSCIWFESLVTSSIQHSSPKWLMSSKIACEGIHNMLSLYPDKCHT